MSGDPCGTLCVFIFVLGISTFVGTIVLRASVGLYNMLVGGVESPSAVPPPSTALAAGIALAINIVEVGGSILVQTLVGATGDAQVAVLSAQLFFLPLSVVITAGLLNVMLPTTFARAFQVTLCSFLLGLIVAIVIGFAVAVVFMILFAGAAAR